MKLFYFYFYFYFQWVVERFVVACLLVLDKFCIIILNFQFCFYKLWLNFDKENLIEI